jgi:hypothetical protein
MSLCHYTLTPRNSKVRALFKFQTNVSADPIPSTSLSQGLECTVGVRNFDIKAARKRYVEWNGRF